MALHRADHPEFLLAINIFPADLDDPLQLHQLPGNLRNAPIEWVGCATTSDPDRSRCLDRDADHAHFVFWTILIQTVIGFGIAYLIDQKFRAMPSGPR